MTLIGNLCMIIIPVSCVGEDSEARIEAATAEYTDNHVIAP